jgi:hypothetical protein
MPKVPLNENSSKIDDSAAIVLLFPGMLLSMVLLKSYKDAVMLWQKSR